jgi:Transmembrane secretion effector
VRRREICLSADPTTAAAPTTPAPSRWGPFIHLAFTVIRTASLVSNVGTVMSDTASGWLITSLDANPITVSLVQVAVSLLISVEVAILAVSVVFAGLVSLNLATPSLLNAVNRTTAASLGHSRKARGFLPGIDIEPRKRGKDA